MKILICGDYGVFCKELISRLKKEKHEIYVITGSEIARRKKPIDGVFQEYHFSYRSKNIQTIMSNVHADVMIMLGFCDTKFEWKDVNKDSVNYLSGMTNLLTAAKENGIKKVLYCSTLGIFENTSKKQINSNTESSTNTKLMHMMEQVDHICSEQKSTEDFEVIRVRFPEVYGDINTNEYNICTNLMLNYINKSVMEIYPEKEHRIIHVKDAVNALMFLITEENCRSLYMVPGTVHSEAEIVEEIKKVLVGYSVEIVEKKEETPIPISKIGSSFITNEKYNLHTGLQELSKVIEREQKTENEKRETSTLGTKIFAVIENLALFLIVTLIMYIFRGSWFAENVHLYLFYILIIAIQYGCNHALIAGTLVITASLFNSSSETKVLDYSGLVNEIQYLIVGVFAGYMRDRYKQKNAELDDEKRYFQTELMDMTRIYDGNKYVKELYEKRIVNYENSLSNIHDIIRRLDFWEPQKVIFQAVDVIQELMGVKDVAIYIGGNKNQYMRLSASTSERARGLGNSIKLDEEFFMYDEIVQKNAYLNKTLDVITPSMACGVYSEHSLNAIVMIWTDDLLQLNLYQSNMLALLCKVIENSMARASAYWNDFTEQYIENTNILLENSFRSMLEVLDYGKKSNMEDYVLLKVNTDNIKLEENDLYEKITSLVRESDYVGKVGDCIYVMLTNADEEDVRFVVDRFASSELLVEQVSHL